MTTAPTPAPSPAPPRRVRGDWPWHVILLALWPPLALYALHPQEAQWTDAITGMGLVVAGAMMTFVLFLAITRDRGKAGILTSLAIVIFFSYALLHEVTAYGSRLTGAEFLTKNDGTVRGRYVVAIQAGIIVFAMCVALAGEWNLRPVTRFLNVLAVALLFIAATPLLRQIIPSGHTGRATTVATVGAGSSGTGTTPTDESHRDIYYVILDRYPSNEILREAYHYNNDDFHNALEARGFFVAAHSRANYARSCLSIASSLNMDYLPTGISQGEVIRAFRRRHRVGEILRDLGYRYLHIGSWYTGTSRCALADESLHPAAGIWSEFMTALMGMTPAREVIFAAEADRHASGALYQFDAVERVAETPGPKFVFAHLLLPHPPFVFNADGTVREASGFYRDYDEPAKKRFIAQLQFTNRRVLEMVDALQARPGPPPAIILQADEGPWLRGIDQQRRLDDCDRIRTGILNTFALPGIDLDERAMALTPVNTFRLLLSHEFGLDLPLLEDRVFTWPGMHRPMDPDPGVYHFEDATDRLPPAGSVTPRAP